MSPHDPFLSQALANLRLPTPQPERERRLRQRCRDGLRKRQRLANLSRIAALAALFLYLSAALGESLRLAVLR